MSLSILKRLIFLLFVLIWFSPFNLSFSQKPNIERMGKLGGLGYGWTIVYQGEKMGALDSQGKMVLPKIYDHIEPFDVFHKGWARVQLGNIRDSLI